jgi:AhpD family alkylhydroperoxidase
MRTLDRKGPPTARLPADGNRALLRPMSQPRPGPRLHGVPARHTVGTASDTGGNMEHTTRIPPAEVTGVKGALIKRITEKKLGKVPTALGVYWHNPKVLFATSGLGGKLQKWDACDESLKSFAHIAVASLVGCSWCLDFNYFEARNKGLDVEKARERAVRSVRSVSG